MEKEVWDRRQKYIHKYNTRSALRYSFATAVLQHDSLADHFDTGQEFINHVLHQTTGAMCSYNKLAVGAIPGQSVNVWKT